MYKVVRFPWNHPVPFGVLSGYISDTFQNTLRVLLGCLRGCLGYI